MNSNRTLLKRVSVKLMLSFIAVAVVPVLIIGLFAGHTSKSTLLQVTKDKQVERLNDRKNGLNAILNNSKNAATFLARSSAMTRYLAAVNNNNDEEIIPAKRYLQKEMVTFASSYGQLYSTVRYLDNSGQEQIRVNLNGKSHKLVSKSKLQNKSDTPYYKESLDLGSGSVYVSQLNLNRENNKIEVPHRPLLRYVAPVFNTAGQRAGMVVLSIQAASFLQNLGEDLLLNQDGYYLHHTDVKILWGAPSDLGTEISYKAQYPDNWKAVSSQTDGNYMSDIGGEHFASYAPFRVPGSDRVWYLIAKDTEADILAPINSFQIILYSLIVLSLFSIAVFAFYIGSLVTKPLSKLTSVVKRVAGGDEQARANISSQDEFADLGNALDNMIEERMSTLHRAEKENEALNDSIIELMEATSKLSENDLSIKIAVREDVTGVVADGLNKMVTETAKILNGIKLVSQEVQQAAESVRSQSNRVTEVASQEREIVEHTLSSLNKSAKTMTEIADVAQSCNDLADRASISTEKALATVNNTVEGMNDIRETISETEKRIKRLGERSQEITSVVEIINNIAERTHVLALNASMQAAAAGEAGRGFAVVADEVQRLAENSRDSTSQIATLVHSIQTETSETMATMNKSISQVVSGSELAEQSGQQMEETQSNTKALVAVVEKIAQRSAEQAMFSEVLRQNAAGIQQSTEVTSQELTEQSKHTVNLVDYAQRLKDAVEVFKLPPAS